MHQALARGWPLAQEYGRGRVCRTLVICSSRNRAKVRDMSQSVFGPAPVDTVLDVKGIGLRNGGPG